MHKAKSLRAAIVAAMPEFATSPDRLKIWVEDGQGRSTQSRTLSFAFGYRLNVLLIEARTDIALVALAVFRWLRVNQPDLLAPGQQGFTFETDVLDESTADIVIQLDLTECVEVTAREDGGWNLDYLAEPDPLMDDELGAADVEPIPQLADYETDEDPEG